MLNEKRVRDNRDGKRNWGRSTMQGFRDSGTQGGRGNSGTRFACGISTSLGSLNNLNVSRSMQSRIDKIEIICR